MIIGKLSFDLGGESVTATLDGDRWTVQCADPDILEMAELRLNDKFVPRLFQSPEHGFAAWTALKRAAQAFGGVISDEAPLPPDRKGVVY